MNRRVSLPEALWPGQLTALWRNAGVRLSLLSIIVAATFFANGDALVPDIMESRNLIAAREMVEAGTIDRFIVPTLNGQLRMEKPPLPTWIAAGVEAVSPGNLAMHRFCAALMGVVLVIFFYKFAKRVLRQDPVIATLLLCTCHNVMLMGRTVSWDIYTHALMLGAIYHLSLALLDADPRHTTHRYLSAGLFMGLSILSKGPVSLYALFLPYLTAFCICMRRRITIRGHAGALAAMTAIALVVGCGWYAYAYTIHGEEMKAIAAKESGAWINHNVRPWYYYHAFYLETGVWSLLLPSAIVLSFVPWRRVRTLPVGQWFPLLWMGAALVLLSLLPEKKTRYLLPMLIPAAYVMNTLIARWVSLFTRKDSKEPQSVRTTLRVAYSINAWLLTGVIAALPAAGYLFAVRNGLMPMWVWVTMTVIILLLVLLMGIAATRRRPAMMVWVTGVLFAAAELIAFPSIARLINNPEMRSISATTKIESLRDIPFYYDANAPEGVRIELVYAARRNILPLNLRDSAAVADALPFALLSHEGAARQFTPERLADVDTIHIGVYDDNRRPKGTRRYSSEFIYHLTLIRPKNARP